MPLNEVADFCLGKMLDEKKNRGEALPYLANVNVRWGEFDTGDLRLMRFEPDEMDRYGLKYGDIVMCEGGEPGRCAIWKESVSGMMIQKALHRIRPRDCLDYRFLYFSFLHLGRIGGFAPLFTGATIKHLPRQQLAKLVVEVPPLPVQDRIASVLSAYDNLIENNTRRIALLEQAARLLYEEWFVRLRFPGREHTRIVDGVPKGWEKKTLGSLCREVREQVSPTDVEPDAPYIGLEHIPRRSITLGTWGAAEQVTSTKHRYRAGEILFGKIRPYFHKVGIALTDGVASSDAIVIRPNQNDLRCLVLMVVSSDYFVRTTSKMVREGSKMPRADWKTMQQFAVLMPPKGILDTFNVDIEPILAQLRVLTFQSRNARQARDLLLPRLMSGELVA